MKEYLKLMRIRHYIKNILIIIPVFFSLNLINREYIIAIVFAFFSFSIASSIIYIINDIQDIEKDKLHTTKCKRPLPSGTISVKNAKILLCFLTLLLL